MGRMGRRIAASGAAVLLLLAGCGDDDSDDDDAGTEVPAGEEVDEGDEAPAEPTSLDLTAIDYGFEGVEAVGAGALTINLTNTGAEPHQAVLMTLNDGATAEDVAAATDEAGVFALGSPVGGPVAALPGAPAESATIAVEPGEYAVICFIPDAAGVPHYASGMVSPLTVTEGEGAEVPAGDETITATDFAFDIPEGFTGAGSVDFDNAGEQPHEVAIFQLGDGATAEDVLAFFSPDAPGGPPPFTRLTGVGAMEPGQDAGFAPSLAPGNYVAFCFIVDPESGAPHFALGMQAPFSVT